MIVTVRRKLYTCETSQIAKFHKYKQSPYLQSFTNLKLKPFGNKFSRMFIYCSFPTDKILSLSLSLSLAPCHFPSLLACAYISVIDAMECWNSAFSSVQMTSIAFKLLCVLFATQKHIDRQLLIALKCYLMKLTISMTFPANSIDQKLTATVRVSLSQQNRLI